MGANFSYQYDHLNRATVITQNPVGGLPSIVLNQTFDSADERINLATTIGGTQDSLATYVYDDLSRMTQIQQSGAASAKRVDLTYTALDKFNTIKNYSDLTGTNLVAQSAYLYDAAARVTSINHTHGATSLASYAYQYDPADRITQFTTPDGISTFSYDRTNQLTNVANAATPETYTYDANGNRTVGSYQTGAGNRLITDGTYNYTYDGEGNLQTKQLVSDPTKLATYTWDHRNRLTRVQSNIGGNLDEQFTYDAFDRRTSKSTSTQASRFVYEGADIALAYSGTGTPALSNRYLHGPAVDQLFADEQVTGGTPGTYWALGDHLGSVRDLVNSSGSSVRHRKFDSFGQMTNVSGNVDTLFAYTGRELDTETGLQFNRERYYDPKVGRWLGEDPLRFRAGDSNLYRYVGNGPSNSMDPTGLDQLFMGAPASSGQWSPGSGNCAGIGNGVPCYGGNGGPNVLNGPGSLFPSPGPSKPLPPSLLDDLNYVIDDVVRPWLFYQVEETLGGLGFYLAVGEEFQQTVMLDLLALGIDFRPPPRPELVGPPDPTRPPREGPGAVTAYGDMVAFVAAVEGLARPGLPEPPGPRGGPRGSPRPKPPPPKPGPGTVATDEEVIGQINSVPTHFADEFADPGVRGTFNPSQGDIWYHEPVLDPLNIDAVKPFDQALSDAGGQPIRAVITDTDEIHIMQGNNRVFGAAEDGLQSIEGILYTAEEWEELTGSPFIGGGTNNPLIGPRR